MSLEAYLTTCDERYAMCCESDGFVVVEVNNVGRPPNVQVSPDLLRLTKAPKVPHLHEETGHRLKATDSTRLQTRKTHLDLALVKASGKWLLLYKQRVEHGIDRDRL